MSSVGRVGGRLRGRPQERHDDYAFCPQDRFWFRPAYTEGTCPLCGEPPPLGASAATSGAMEHSWLGVGVLALESLVMLGLVLFMYFRG